MPDNKRKKIALVGAGPVGSLLSVVLARRGHDVTVFERRPDMRVESISAGRSINLAVSVRGLHALRQIGLEAKVLEHAVAMKGRMMHALDGTLTYQPYGRDDSECIYSISRGGLNQVLMTHAEATGKVDIRFRHRVTGVDFQSGTLNYSEDHSVPRGGAFPSVDSDAKVKSFRFDHLIGTDGSASVIRETMAHDPGFQATETYLDYGYKELTIPPEHSSGMERNALHIWPRGAFMLIALPNFEGSYTCTLFLRLQPTVECPESFAGLTNITQVRAFFEREFADVLPRLPHLTEEFFEHPTGRMVTVKCGPWSHGERSLLLGDAAHAIVPFFGQGMNCGFEDTVNLAAELDRSGEDFGRAFTEFARNRKPDADAIADLAVDNFTEMRDRVGDARFLFEKKIERLLQEKFPDQYVSRYSLVSFTRLPYRLALAAGVVQNEILAELAVGLERPEQVDLVLAERLIREKLTFLKSK